MQASYRFLAVAASAAVLSIGLTLGSQTPAAGKEEKPQPEPFGRFTLDQVERRLGQPNIHVFDGNPPAVYTEHHLPGAVRLNHNEITARTLPGDRNATLIFYCMNEL